MKKLKSFEDCKIDFNNLKTIRGGYIRQEGCCVQEMDTCYYTPPGGGPMDIIEDDTVTYYDSNNNEIGSCLTYEEGCSCI